MFRIAIALCLATSAHAEIGQQARMKLLPGEGQCFATVEVRNLVGVYNENETLLTDHGPVVVRYETVGGHNATDFDLVDVMDKPDNVIAVPMHMDLPDGDWGYICLREYLPG